MFMGYFLNISESNLWGSNTEPKSTTTRRLWGLFFYLYSGRGRNPEINQRGEQVQKGGRRQEAGGRRQEAGGRRQEAGGSGGPADQIQALR